MRVIAFVIFDGKRGCFCVSENMRMQDFYKPIGLAWRDVGSDKAVCLF